MAIFNLEINTQSKKTIENARNGKVVKAESIDVLFDSI